MCRCNCADSEFKCISENIQVHKEGRKDQEVCKDSTIQQQFELQEACWSGYTPESTACSFWETKGGCNAKAPICSADNLPFLIYLRSLWCNLHISFSVTAQQPLWPRFKSWTVLLSCKQVSGNITGTYMNDNPGDRKGYLFLQQRYGKLSQVTSFWTGRPFQHKPVEKTLQKTILLCFDMPI